MTNEEEVGRILFFSQMIGCHSCHLMDTRETAKNELFTNFKYHNIGVPVNEFVREINGVTDSDVIAIVAGFIGSALTFVFGSEVQTRTARQAASATYAATLTNGAATTHDAQGAH
jgi:cytochrome c peroxidase